MSELAAVAAAVTASRASFSAAVSRLGSVWRDGHCAAFRDRFATPVDTATTRLLAAVESADRTVDAVFRGLRSLGTDP
ncbi:hypothetical protein [Actinophytocola sp. KF-1]